MPVMTGDVFFPPKSDGCNINLDLKSYAKKTELAEVEEFEQDKHDGFHGAGLFCGRYHCQ